MYPKNIRNAGRPSRTVALNLNNIDLTVQNVMTICSNDNTKELVLELCERLRNILINTNNTETQTKIIHVSSIGTQTKSLKNVSTKTQTEIPIINKESQTEIKVESILDMLENLSDDDRTYLFHNLFENINDKVLNVLHMLNTLSLEDQIKFYKALTHLHTCT